jgi:hypothetical protein
VSNKRSLRFLLVLLFAAFSSAALVLVDAGALGQNANSSTTEDTTQTAAQTNEDISGERADLSGTYTGNLSTTGGMDVGSGPATLTITGNTFDLKTEGGASHGGRIYAVLTRGEVSAALYFTDITDSTTNTPVVYNVRARKRGESLRLWPAPQTKARLTFGPARGRR